MRTVRYHNFTMNTGICRIKNSIFSCQKEPEKLLSLCIGPDAKAAVFAGLLLKNIISDTSYYRVFR